MTRNVVHCAFQDVRELDLTPNPSYNRKNPSVGDGYVDRLVSPWICPMTGLEMNGRFKFVVDWSSGRVLSERAHLMLKKKGHGQGEEEDRIREEDLVVLNPAEKEDEEANAKRRDERKARAKAEKKAEKRKNGAAANEETTDRSTSKGPPEKIKRSKPKPTASTSTSTNGQTPQASALQKDRSKSEVYKSLFSSHSSAQNRPKGNWVTFDPRYN